MRVVNTRDLKRLLDESATDFGDLLDARDDEAGPCREIRVDRERRRLILLVNRKELMSQSFERLGVSGLSMEQTGTIMALWREGRIDALRRHLGLPSEGAR